MTLRPALPALAIAYWLSAILSASAHPGHSLRDATASHLLTSPYHLAVLAGIGLGMLLLGRFVQRTLPRRVLHCGGFAALACAALLWGLRS
jgi:hypothetical protein